MLFRSASNETNVALCHFSRITKPPGGETSDIFTTPTGTPPSTPRKVKNYMASTIFTPVTANGAEQKNARQRPDGNSFNRLFGIGAEDGTDGASPPATPRGGKNYQKSNVIFTGENGHARHTNGNGYARSMNGSEGSYSGSSSGSVTPNGSINGDADHPRRKCRRVNSEKEG